MHSLRHTWRIHVLSILIYTILALALTWPLAAHFGSHVPGDGADDPPLTWNLWWIRHALLEQGSNPFDCDQIFYPAGINLAFYTLTLLNGLLSVPLQGAFGLVPASNILLLSSFILSGYGAFLLARYVLATSIGSRDDVRQKSSGRRCFVGGLDLAAFVGGSLYAFSANKLYYAALGQWNVASSQWIPFYVLCLLRAGDRPGRRRYPLLAAIFLVLQAYAEMTYATFLVLFTALWLVWHLLSCISVGRSARDPGRAQLRGTLVDLIIIAAVFLIGLAPMLIMMIPDLRVEGDIFVEGGGFADVFSADLVGFLVPIRLHPFLGGLVDRFSFDHMVGQHLYMGYSVVALALTAVVVAWRLRPVRFWTVSALAFWLLSLGPALRVNGTDTRFPLPFSVVSRIPFFNGNRYPSRYSVLLILSLSMLAAVAMALLLRSVRRRSLLTRRAIAPRGTRRQTGVRVAVFLTPIMLFLFEHLAAPLPLSDMRIPPVYASVVAETAEGSTLLDIPVAWRNGFRVTGTSDTIIMFEQYYQSFHGRRLLGGNTSRNPPLKFQYFTEAPVINTLIALETGHSVDLSVVERDRSMAAEVLRFFDISSIVVHPGKAGSGVVPFVETIVPLERIYQDETAIAYVVNQQPLPDSWSVVPGEPVARLSFLEGWGTPSGGFIWAQRRANRLLVPLNGQQQRMTFRAFAPGPGEHLQLEVNGSAMRPVPLQSGWAYYDVTLPQDMVRAGLNEIWLLFDTRHAAGMAELSSRQIGQSGIPSPVNIVVQSAGLEVGDLGHIYVNGEDVSPNQRGYNVAVISRENGEVLRSSTFDTHLDEGASKDLAAFLDQVPEGSIVAVCAADEASRLLQDQAVHALRVIGAVGDLRGRFRWGHAVIGVKGASPGTALESLDWMQPVTLVVGDGLTEPRMAAAFSSITFTAASP